MAANTNPIFGLTPNVSWADAALTANTTKDLTSGTIYLVWTAGSNGGYLEEIYLKPLGTNIASLIRLWINNGSTTGTAANNTLFRDYGIPATTNSETAMQPDLVIAVRKPLPAGYRVYVTVATGVAVGYDVTAFGLDY